MTNEAQRLANEAAESAQDWLDTNGAEGVCDFCAHRLELGRVFTWVTDGPVTGTVTAITEDGEIGKIGLVYEPEWGACQSCDRMIALGNIEALVEHVLLARDAERIGPILDLDRAKADMRELYEGLFAANLTRVGPDDERLRALRKMDD
jgi:hypothetical protein